MLMSNPLNLLMVKLTHTDSRQGAADRAAEGWQGEGVAMETGELGGVLQHHSVTWLLVRPELRNSPNTNRRNISRRRAAPKAQIIK